MKSWANPTWLLLCSKNRIFISLFFIKQQSSQSNIFESFHHHEVHRNKQNVSSFKILYVSMGHYSIYSRMQRNILLCMREENTASGPWTVLHTHVDNWKRTWNFVHFILIVIAQYWLISSFGTGHLPWLLTAWKSIYFSETSVFLLFFSFLVSFIFTIQHSEKLELIAAVI